MAHEFGHLYDRLFLEVRTHAGIQQAQRRRLLWGLLQLLGVILAFWMVEGLAHPPGPRRGGGPGRLPPARGAHAPRRAPARLPSCTPKRAATRRTQTRFHPEDHQRRGELPLRDAEAAPVQPGRSLLQPHRPLPLRHPPQLPRPPPPRQTNTTPAAARGGGRRLRCGSEW